MKSTWKNLWHTMLHPADGFTNYKERRNYCKWIAVLSVVLFFISRIVERQYTGFYFNNNQLQELDISMIFIETIVIYILFVVCNWMVSTLADGKAKLFQIAFFCSIALIPYTMSILINTLISNALLADEAMFMTIIGMVGSLWGILILVCGITVFHDYSLGETVKSILMTLIMILIIVFVCLLIFSLAQQVASFVVSVFQELAYRV